MKVPARQAFGMRPATSIPSDLTGHPTAAENFKSIVSHGIEELHEDWTYVSGHTKQWLRDFSIYFAGLLKNSHASRRTAPVEVERAVSLAPSQTRETLVRFFAYSGGIGALSFVAAHFLQPPPVSASVDLTPRPEWLTIAKPHPAFLLSLPDFGEEGRYDILRHADGGGRKDVMTFGEAGRSLRYAMVEVYRPGRELDQFASAPSEIAARARELGPAGAVRSALPLETKFGTISTVEFTVGRFGVGHCIGFVRAENDPRLQISGMSCSMNAIVNRKSVACLLDRLTLMSAGSDPEIAKYFAQAEVKRNFCGQRDPLLYATPKRDYPASPASAVGLRGQMPLR